MLFTLSLVYHMKPSVMSTGMEQGDRGYPNQLLN